MCAMIPMLRVLASGYSRITRFLDPVRWGCSASPPASATSILSAGVATSRPPRGTPDLSARPRCARRSPSVMRERLVRLRHLVHFLAALDREALAGGRGHAL